MLPIRWLDVFGSWSIHVRDRPGLRALGEPRSQRALDLLGLRNAHGLTADSVMGVNKVQGMIPMRERTIGASLDRYKVVRRDWFAYNPMRLNIGSLARWTKDGDVLVSPDYVVFSCNLDQLHPDFFDHFRRSSQWERWSPAEACGCA